MVDGIVAARLQHLLVIDVIGFHDLRELRGIPAQPDDRRLEQRQIGADIGRLVMFGID